MSNLTINEDGPERSSTSHNARVDKPNLKGDWLNFALLTVLFVMQGLLDGVSASLPIIFQSKKVSYQDQALYNIVFWPYTLKLIWAPLIDALYIQWIGRRKSWLLPVQFIAGVFLLYIASNIDVWLPETGKPNVEVLTYLFFVIIVLTVLQDDTVNGWSLTMLKKNNVSYASAAGWIGWSFGRCIGVLSPVLLTSEDFCNSYLRKASGTGGIIAMKSFLYFLGILFITITTLVGVFKREKDSRLEDKPIKIGVLQSYKLLWDILNLPSVRLLAVAIITMRFGFSATFALSNLKLIDSGVSKENITMISAASNITQIVVSLVASKYTSGPKPMSICLKFIIMRLLWCLTYFALIYYTPMMLTKSDGNVFVPKYYYFILGLISTINEISVAIVYVSVMAFFSRISDPRFGSTYMTLFSTIYTAGWIGSTTFTLCMVDTFTIKKCSVDAQNICLTQELRNTCYTNGGSCVTIVDGYYVEVILCLVVGFVWYLVFRNILKTFQEKPSSYWLVNMNQSNI